MKRESLFRQTRAFEILYFESSCGRNMNRGHFHNCYELLYLVSGSRLVSISEKTYTLNAGDMLIVEPYVKHMLTSAPNNAAYARYLMSISPDSFNNILTNAETRQLFANMKTQIMHFNNSSKIECFMKEICSKFSSGEHLARKLANLQTILMIYECSGLCSSVTDIELNGDSRPNNDIINALNYINEHFSEPLTLEILCDRLHTSKSSFYRQFTKTVGIPPMHYVTQKRIIMAHNYLLSNPKASIAEIAEKTGFSTASSMTRFIKEIYGKTPTEIRKLI